MKTSATMMAAALCGLLLSGVSACADDCEDVIEHVEDVVQVASKILEKTMAQVTKAKSEAKDDKANASVKNSFCSASGEFLGVSRAYRVVASECLRGGKRRDTLASLDKSIKELETSMQPICE